MTLCGHSGGDTYLRLFEDSTGQQVMLSDDGCGGRYGASNMQYFVDKSDGDPCGSYTLRQGCYAGEYCFGVTHVTVSGKGAPTALPSGQPTGDPTSVPSSPSGQPSRQPSSVPSSDPTTPSGEPSSQPSYIPSAQPSSLPTIQPSTEPSCEPSSTPQPSSRPTPAFERDMQTTLIVAVGTPASAVLFCVLVLGGYRLMLRRYSRHLDGSSRVRCVSSLRYHDDLDELDLFEDGGFEALRLGE